MAKPDKPQQPLTGKAKALFEAAARFQKRHQPCSVCIHPLADAINQLYQDGRRPAAIMYALHEVGDTAGLSRAQLANHFVKLHHEAPSR